MSTEHSDEMIAFLTLHGLSVQSWVYGSYGRPLHGSWFRLEGCTILQTTHQRPYSYAVVPARMVRADVDGNELELVSRPVRV